MGAPGSPVAAWRRGIRPHRYAHRHCGETGEQRGASARGGPQTIQSQHTIRTQSKRPSCVDEPHGARPLVHCMYTACARCMQHVRLCLHCMSVLCVAGVAHVSSLPSVECIRTRRASGRSGERRSRKRAGVDSREDACGWRTWYCGGRLECLKGVSGEEGGGGG